jgi:hypothetical protein
MCNWAYFYGLYYILLKGLRKKLSQDTRRTEYLLNSSHGALYLYKPSWLEERQKNFMAISSRLLNGRLSFRFLLCVTILEPLITCYLHRNSKTLCSRHFSTWRAATWLLSLGRAYRLCFVVCCIGAQVSAGTGLLNGGKSRARHIQKTHCTSIQAPFNQNSCDGISWDSPPPSTHVVCCCSLLTLAALSLSLSSHNPVYFRIQTHLRHTKGKKDFHSFSRSNNGKRNKGTNL